jgi:hypothetical protein
LSLAFAPQFGKYYGPLPKNDVQGRAVCIEYSPTNLPLESRASPDDKDNLFNSPRTCEPGMDA